MAQDVAKWDQLQTLCPVRVPSVHSARIHDARASPKEPYQHGCHDRRGTTASPSPWRHLQWSRTPGWPHRWRGRGACRNPHGGTSWLKSSHDQIGRTNLQAHFATNSTMYPCGRSPSSHPIAPPWVPLRGPPVGTPFGGKPRRRRVPALELTPHELFNSACLSSSQSTACPSTSHCSAYTPSFLLCNYNYNYN